MTQVALMADILRSNYTLSELEDRFGATSEDLYNGLEDYVEQNYETVSQGLREDLWSLEDN